MNSRVRTFLTARHIAFDAIPHAEAFTAQETAAASHIAGRHVAKTVIIEVDGDLAMAVIPADSMVDIERFRRLVGARSAQLSSEGRFAGAFPDCEPGAMPPFGNLYGVEVAMERQLAADDVIAFNAGDHTELVRLASSDFSELEHPIVRDFVAPLPS